MQLAELRLIALRAAEAATREGNKATAVALIELAKACEGNIPSPESREVASMLSTVEISALLLH